MIVRHTKILLLFQILTIVFSWDWSWEFDRSWSGPYQKFLKLENFRRYLQLGKELESYDSFNLNAQNFQILGKLGISSRTKKNLKSWEFLAGLKFIEKGQINLTYQKKGSFSTLLIRSGPAQILSFN